MNHAVLMLSAFLFVTSKGYITGDILNLIPVISKCDPSKVLNLLHSMCIVVHFVHKFCRRQMHSQGSI